MRRALFVGRGSSSQCYYRIALPAMALGQDWVGVAGEPPHIRHVTGLVRGDTRQPKFEDYDAVVLQTPRAGWRKPMKQMQARGITVLVEVDDYLRAVGKVKDHDFKRYFDRDAIRQLELNMRLADGIIVSTQWLADKYRALNPNIWVCENGLDLARYDLTRPPRLRVNIGWAGGTGHRTAVGPWLPIVAQVMSELPDTTFVSIGQPYADVLADTFPGRTLSLPWAPVETYPCAMTLFDVAIAPAGTSLFFRGKSDLRFLEAGALGIPCVADPSVYPALEDGVSGLHASTPEEALVALRKLITDAELRTRLGDAAQEWVREHGSVTTTASQWDRALVEATRVDEVADVG